MMTVQNLKDVRTRKQQAMPGPLRGLEPLIKLPIDSILIVEGRDGKPAECFIRADKFIEAATDFMG